jgi:hypothetical protein
MFPDVSLANSSSGWAAFSRGNHLDKLFKQRFHGPPPAAHPCPHQSSDQHHGTLGFFMRIVSGLIRIITGLAVMAMAAHVYLANRVPLEGSDPVTVVIVGQEITATPTQIIIGLITTAAIGGMIELLGIFTLVHKPKTATKPTSEVLP